MFLDPEFSLVGTGEVTTQRYEYIEAATPEEMTAKFNARIAAIVAENVARAAADPALPEFNIYDCDISGGGDGHTFVVRLLLSTWNPDDTTFIARWEAGVLQEVAGQFWLASSEDALATAASAGISAFVAGADTVSSAAAGMAGAAKGTRFMGFIAGLVERD